MSSYQVFLTRPRGRNGMVPERLSALGARVLELPALEVRALAPATPVPRPNSYDLVVFVSRFAAQRYLELLSAQDGVDLVWPEQTLAATVGAASAQALIESGLVPVSNVVYPPVEAGAQDSEALLDTLLERHATPARVLIVRGTQGRAWLGSQLSARGARVEFLPVYERRPATWCPQTSDDLADALGTPERCIFLLTSSEGVVAIAERLGELGLLAQWAKASFVVLHERIGATLQSVVASQSDAGVRRLKLCMPDDDSIVEAIHAVADFAAKP